jgi:hypothetical protein
VRQHTASGRSRTKVAKAALISVLVSALEDLDLQPHGASGRQALDALIKSPPIVSKSLDDMHHAW